MVILQLLKVLLVCYAALQTDWSNKPRPHNRFCKMGNVSMIVWIFIGSEPYVMLVHEPTKVEMDFIPGSIR
jgi:hypothetical protein